MVSLLNQSKLLILLHGQKENNELMSASSPDAQSLFSMTENNSNGNAGKKQKEQCHFSLPHARSASFFKNNKDLNV